MNRNASEKQLSQVRAVSKPAAEPKKRSIGSKDQVFVPSSIEPSQDKRTNSQKAQSRVNNPSPKVALKPEPTQPITFDLGRVNDPMISAIRQESMKDTPKLPTPQYSLKSEK